MSSMPLLSRLRSGGGKDQGPAGRWRAGRTVMGASTRARSRLPVDQGGARGRSPTQGLPRPTTSRCRRRRSRSSRRLTRLGVAVQGGELAERVGPGVDPGELVQPVPLELGLGPPQLGLGRSRRRRAARPPPADLELLEGHPVAGPGVGVAQRGAADQSHGAGAGALGELVAADQAPVEPGRSARARAPSSARSTASNVAGARGRQPPGQVDRVRRDVGRGLLPRQPAERRQRVGVGGRRAADRRPGGRSRSRPGRRRSRVDSRRRSTAPRCWARSGCGRRPARPPGWRRSGRPSSRSSCARTGGRRGR